MQGNFHYPAFLMSLSEFNVILQNTTKTSHLKLYAFHFTHITHMVTHNWLLFRHTDVNKT